MATITFGATPPQLCPRIIALAIRRLLNTLQDVTSGSRGASRKTQRQERARDSCVCATCDILRAHTHAHIHGHGHRCTAEHEPRTARGTRAAVRNARVDARLARNVT